MAANSAEIVPSPMRLGGGNWIYFETDGLQIKRKNWSFKIENKDFIQYNDIGKVDVAWSCFKGILKIATSSGKTVVMSCSKKMLMDAASYIHAKSKQEDSSKKIRELPKETKKKLKAKVHPTVGITDAGLMLKRTVNPCKSTATFVPWEQIVSAQLEPTLFRSAEITISTSILKTDVFAESPTSLPKPAPKPAVPKKKRCSCCSCFAKCCACCKKKKPEEKKEEPEMITPKEELWGDVDDDFAVGYVPTIMVYEEFVVGGKLKELQELFEIMMPEIGNKVIESEADAPLEILAKGNTKQMTEVRKSGINVQNNFCCGCWGWERIFLPWNSLLTTQYVKKKCYKTGKMNIMAHNGGQYTLKKVNLSDFDRISKEFSAQVEEDRYWMAKLETLVEGTAQKGVSFEKLGLTVDDARMCSTAKTFVPWNKVDSFVYSFGCFGGAADLVTWSSRKITIASGMKSKKIWAVYDKINTLKYKTESDVKYFNVRRNPRMSCSYSDSALKLVIKTGMFSSVVKEYDLSRLIQCIWKYRPDTKKKYKDLIIKLQATQKSSDLEQLIVFPLDKKEDAEALSKGITECADRRRGSMPSFESPSASGAALTFEDAMAKVEQIEKKEEKKLQETLKTVDREISIFDKYKTSPKRDIPLPTSTITETTTTSTSYSGLGDEAPGAKLAAQLQKLEADIAKREPSPRPLIGRTTEKTEAPGAKLAAELQKLEADIARREPSPRPELGRLSPPASAEASKPGSPGEGTSTSGGLYGRNIGRLNAIFESKKDKTSVTSTSDSTTKMSAVQERAQRILNEVKGPDSKYGSLGLSGESRSPGASGIASPTGSSPDTSLSRLAALRGEMGK
mmetsp:Transcript_108985/g.198529  ORF Transcript_108985/g.198529 Transcript_108985/m.198529 type:complete len:849 (-) Transcript_108985:108-2654(-)